MYCELICSCNLNRTAQFIKLLFASFKQISSALGKHIHTEFLKLTRCQKVHFFTLASLGNNFSVSSD